MEIESNLAKPAKSRIKNFEIILLIQSEYHIPIYSPRNSPKIQMMVKKNFFPTIS